VAVFLAVSTALVFLAFAAHILTGGAYEARTVGALSIRSLFWIAVALVARRAMKTTPNGSSPR
jgi:predicted tellurium resistance membrane protein TerC